MASPTGRVLLLRRSLRVSKPGLWAIPAGRVEPGEEVLHGAVRELYEETGYVGRLRVIERLIQPRFHNFVAVCDEEFRPKLNWENDMAGWFAPNYRPHPMHPGTEYVLHRLSR